MMLSLFSTSNISIQIQNSFCEGVLFSEYKAAKGDKKFFATCRDPELVSELTIQVMLNLNIFLWLDK